MIYTFEGLVALADLETVSWWTGFSSSANRHPCSQSGSLSHNKGDSIEHIFIFPLDRKGSSYHDELFLSERLYLKECYILSYKLLLYGNIFASAPIQN